MTAILKANQALTIANQALEQTDNLQEGRSNGRRYRHWSFYVLTSAAFAGAAAAIAAWALAVNLLIVAGVVLCVSSAIGAYYIRKFDQLRDLSDYVEVLSGRIQLMATQLNAFKEIEKNLSTTKDTLEANSKETGEIWDKGEKGMKKQLKEMAVLQKKFEETEKKMKELEKYKQLFTDLSKTVGTLSSHVAGFNDQNKVFGKEINTLAGEIKRHEEVVKTLHHADQAFDENMKNYETLNQNNIDFLVRLEKELANLKQFYYDSKSKLARAEETVKKAHEAALAAEASTKQAEEIQKEGEELIKQYMKKKKEQQQVLVDIAESLKKKKGDKK